MPDERNRDDLMNNAPDTTELLIAEKAALQQEISTLRQDVEALRRENTMLRENTRWLSTLFDRASIGLVTATLNGHIGQYNPAFCEMLGYTNDEIDGMDFRAFTHPDDLLIEIPLFEELLADQRASYKIEKRYLHKEGHNVWVRVLISLGHDATGKPQVIIASVENITEHKQAELALRESEEQYRTIIQKMRDGVFLLDKAKLVFANESFANMLGYTEEEIVQLEFADVIAPEDLTMVVERNRLRMGGEQIAEEYEFRMLHKNGSRLIVSMSVGSVMYQNDMVMMGTFRDVTDRKQVEEELRTFKALTENSPDGIAVTDFNGVHRYANQAYHDLYGYDELVGMHAADLCDNNELARLSDALEVLMKQGHWQSIVTYHRKDGTTFPGQVSVFVVPDEQGNPQALGAIVRDMTDQQRQEEERAALQQHVIEAQHAAIRELSSPLIPLSDDVVLMPLIGSIDTTRAQQVMEVLLEGIAQYQAETAIIDITGVSVVDTQVANGIIQAARAVKLLGAQVVLTGIGPLMAQTLVHLGADLNTIQTRGSLQRAVVEAFR